MAVTVPDQSTPYTHDLLIRRGNSFLEDFTFIGKDYTTYVIGSEIRDIYTRSLIDSFTTTLTSLNIITLACTAAQTSSLRPGQYEYDLVLYYDDSTVTRVKGILNIESNTTENT
jgi:hypothetical protein